LSRDILYFFAWPHQSQLPVKGGTGKTTITALIVRYLKEHEKGPVLVMDADPDANLGTLLGDKT
jgi:CO dehydrogenase nickel-insertion accessory protein CooC1